MSATSARRWYLVHKWSSLVCTVFLLVICISGLPLVFQDEINDAVKMSREAPPLAPGDTREADLDQMIAQSRARFPGQLIGDIYWADDEPAVFVSLVPSFEAVREHPDLAHWLKFDVRTAELINTSEQYERDMSAPLPRIVTGLMSVLLHVHVDLFAKLPGQLFLSFMALLFVVAIVSGGVLYGPFMKKLSFGTVRRGRSARLKWLDLHNLLGIVVLTWMFVVGVTGAINEIAVPLMQVWVRTEVRSAWSAYAGHAPPAQEGMASVHAAVDTARRAVPDMTVTNMLFPRPDFGSAYHYWFWAQGSTPLSKRLSTVVLVDARTGELTRVLGMPWYLTALDLSRPLHFGNYGGLPLKMLWAVFDLITIAVLISGLYLWFARRQQNRLRLERLMAAQVLQENVHGEATTQ